MNRTIQLLAPLLALAVAFAGCTEDARPETDATPTSPTPTTPTDAASGDHASNETPDANETPEVAPPLECSQTAPATATSGERSGYTELVYALGGAAGCAGFEGPANATAGWTAITLENAGMGIYILPMLRLEEGHTYEEYLDASATSHDPPVWAVPVGGVGGATPGSNGTVVLELHEGTYVVTAVDVGNPDAPAMLRPLTVGAAEGEATEAPEATLEITLEDFGYVLPENVTAGAHVVRFTNNGTQPHEAPLVQLVGNATMEEFLAFASGEAQGGAPPGALVGGVNVLAPGEVAYALVDLSAGNYGFVCFVSSPTHDGAPHFLLGMMTSFSVA